MKKYLPIIVVILVLASFAYIVVEKKKLQQPNAGVNEVYNIGTFVPSKNCAKLPNFLQKLHIPQPVMIDLSQKKYKGIALLFDKGFSRALHPKQWEQYGHFSTYALDDKGNIYLVPTPFISIEPTTFNLQKNIYKVDTNTGKVSIFMHLDDVHPASDNPYGINAIVYDCEDKTLWVAAIDESDYQSQKGVIYHINLQTKEIMQKIEGFDVLSMTLLKSKQGKYLLLGSARDNGLYAYNMHTKEKPKKILELPSANEHIRKIKIKSANRLELQSIPFSYTLIAQTAEKYRTLYDLKWDFKKMKWEIVKQ